MEAAVETAVHLGEVPLAVLLLGLLTVAMVRTTRRWLLTILMTHHPHRHGDNLPRLRLQQLLCPVPSLHRHRVRRRSLLRSVSRTLFVAHAEFRQSRGEPRLARRSEGCGGAAPRTTTAPAYSFNLWTNFKLQYHPRPARALCRRERIPTHMIQTRNLGCASARNLGCSGRSRKKMPTREESSGLVRKGRMRQTSVTSLSGRIHHPPQVV